MRWRGRWRGGWRGGWRPGGARSAAFVPTRPPGIRAQVQYYSLKDLKLKPEQFKEHLTQRLCFVMVADLQVDKEACVQGFDRPLWVLQKPAR